MFQNCESALRWAYNTASRPIVKLSTVHGMRRVVGHYHYPNPLLDDLTAQERHSQAALIIGLIDKLDDPVEVEYVRARFGRRTDPRDLLRLVCYCCIGLGIGPDRSEAMYRVLREYFAGQVSTRMVRREIGCRHHSAVVVRHRLCTALEMVELRALSDIGRILEERGLVEPARHA
jgi:hypothetical protein